MALENSASSFARASFSLASSFFFFFSRASASSNHLYWVFAKSFSICRVRWDGGPAAAPGGERAGFGILGEESAD
jgi:hypothetical protein